MGVALYDGMLRSIVNEFGKANDCLDRARKAIINLGLDPDVEAEVDAAIHRLECARAKFREATEK